jgi:hypothetical protein
MYGCQLFALRFPAHMAYQALRFLLMQNILLQGGVGKHSGLEYQFVSSGHCLQQVLIYFRYITQLLPHKYQTV